MASPPTVADKAVALVEDVTRALGSGMLHRNRKGELLTTPKLVLQCLREEGEVQLSRVTNVLAAYQPMGGVELGEDVEITGAPLHEAANQDHWRFLIWVDQEVLPLAKRGVRTLTAVAPDGTRKPITAFVCNPREEGTLE